MIEQAAQAALEKKASDLVLLGMKGVVSFTDYFLLCTGASAPQVRAISDSVEEQLRRRGLRPAHSEGYEQAEWVLLDYVDFVVHVFSPRARAYYDLERLWRRAARLPVPEDERPKE
ncbi:MAG: ribosome silencing factor [Acidobacteria bacterium RIFCSPHIGHO2_12_FULL_67_30]|nr:MAG: ribosome silencing factor [Acidobacteria bacterium RIFCSPHIGHO2_02_FULL_67_57]OFV85081.1 MAG: ribosome silencing factor [Acidobacteria bacterium RIFCSPHIGHO2_01_FULL_67_28]OFV87047.1 MAG: ribosome silencing factor [Acidobacteria bacterium RIFCSPHIGHO2_12_FULL_67_30]